ncbi:hypothetical protein TVAG_193010 [Trichomonas vaginalis G3]|uniref:Thioredoxin domain-containing protein n=1 Tax=Trichomonas vaginalis (strain ATCC PRA-98 / G3) TaxID=412133 RepID=A2DH15_TRIV3|nr:disulfide-isomerase A6 family [Trichomonas vaginalis G3]EAY20325.1 hypothetical protein TVAG_193010 [Trichomonas vaginalis G3]KAI5530686.1 disulfide-isomerase A6 family [Trichomonas vaginalis G3]|eukprot:XP_001581311.1 hypothetical protein [Trichomonas vaginalis G3]
MFSFLFASAVSYSAHVKHLNAPGFRDFVVNRKGSEIWVVLFIGRYANQATIDETNFVALEEIEKAANQSYKFCNYAYVNVTQDPFVAVRHQVTYVPCIQIYYQGGVEEYRGNHKAESYLEAISNRMPNLVRNFDKKWTDDSVPSIVLFTDQTKSPTLWSALSIEYKDAFVRFGICSDFYLHRQFNIARLPTVMFFNSTTQYRYRGELTEDLLKTSIDQFLNGIIDKESDFDDEGFYHFSEFKDQCFGRDFCVVSTFTNISDTLRNIRLNSHRHPMKFFYGASDFPIKAMEAGKFYIWKPRGHGLITVNYLEELSPAIDRVLDGGAHFKRLKDDEL